MGEKTVEGSGGDDATKKPDDGTDAANAAGAPESVSGLEEGSSDTPNKTNNTQTDTETDGTSGSGSTPRETETTDDPKPTASGDGSGAVWKDGGSVTTGKG